MPGVNCGYILVKGHTYASCSGRYLAVYVVKQVNSQLAECLATQLIEILRICVANGWQRKGFHAAKSLSLQNHLFEAFRVLPTTETVK